MLHPDVDVNDDWVKQAFANLNENHLNLYLDSQP